MTKSPNLLPLLLLIVNKEKTHNIQINKVVLDIIIHFYKGKNNEKEILHFSPVYHRHHNVTGTKTVDTVTKVLVNTVDYRLPIYSPQGMYIWIHLKPQNNGCNIYSHTIHWRKLCLNNTAYVYSVSWFYPIWSLSTCCIICTFLLRTFLTCCSSLSFKHK